LIHETDNVATAIFELRTGDTGRFASKRGPVRVGIVETIPQYHKFAIRDIGKGERVCKYGEVIGEALADIPGGAHVHVHNLASFGGRK